jgi:hypothetical protein
MAVQRRASKVATPDDPLLVEKRRKGQILAIVGMVVIGVMLLIVGLLIHIPFGLDDPASMAFTIFPLTAIGASVLSATKLYLDGGFRVTPELPTLIRKYNEEVASEFISFQKSAASEAAALRTELDRTRAEVTALQDEMVNLKAVDGIGDRLEDSDRANLVATLKNQLETQAAHEVLVKIQADAAAIARLDSRDGDIRGMFGDSQRRLLSELDNLGRRGNLNLILGGFTTMVGISLLGWTVFKEVIVANDWWSFAAHFGPRFTLVVLIELFAFFFLSLYKTTLGEIKYFQNELTNVEAKQIALYTALSNEDKTMLAGAVNALAATERNHILNKDQTTVDLEKAKIDRQGMGDVLKSLTEVLKKLEK